MVSKNPQIVNADYRRYDSPHFLYFPIQEPNIIFLDNLEIIQKRKNWDIWKKLGPLLPAPLSIPIQEFLGKGLGMFATHPIKAGQLIMLECPISITHMQFRSRSSTLISFMVWPSKRHEGPMCLYHTIVMVLRRVKLLERY